MPIEEITETISYSGEVNVVEEKQTKAPKKKKKVAKSKKNVESSGKQANFHSANVAAREAYNSMKRRENALKK